MLIIDVASIRPTTDSVTLISGGVWVPNHSRGQDSQLVEPHSLHSSIHNDLDL
ncbi:hypothetical protein CGMCC3_g4078 [Colletotrichum fructicola]|nr:uncharacterized protein CGMCC3_g4078 [Colletotrichum fructicola]KAE9579627.1 hypothetical protein CGMCC3_g4078 [Colletotrichum fructicola]